MRALLIAISAFYLSMTSYAVSEATDGKRVMTTAWYSWDPYQFIDPNHPRFRVTGLDIALVKGIIEGADYRVSVKEVLWKQQLQDVKDGVQDFASGATKTPEREVYAYFTKPYRFEENSLFVRRGEEGILDTSSIDQFLASIVETDAKISVLDGFVYADPKINTWINDPQNQNHIIRVKTDQGSIDALRSGQVQGFLADRLVGSTMIWRQDLGSEINEINLNLKTPIHLMFSKKTTSLRDIERINQSIDAMKDSAQYNDMIRSYLYPVLLLQTASTWWFQFVEILGIVAFAISGVLIAYRQNGTLFATFLFALLPSVGGGIMRDLMLQRKPIGVMMSPWYLGIVLLTVLGGFLLIRLTHSNGKLKRTASFLNTSGATLLMFADALGLASFTVTGVIVSVLVQAKPLWLWGGFFVFLTSTGGGILRDLLSEKKEIIALSGPLYAEVALLWGTLLSLFLIHQSQSVSSDPIQYAVVVTIIGTFVTRVLCYFLKIENARLKKG